MKTNRLSKIEGTKIRWQYFTVPILVLLSCAVWVSYSLLVFQFTFGEFQLSEWLSGLLISFEGCLVCSFPFVFLSVLNRRIFGKIICVLNDDGIHYKDGIIKWNEIVKMEYEIKIPRRRKLFNPKYRKYRCHAIIYTRKRKIVLMHAPLFLLSKSRKYYPDINAKVSKGSKRRIVLLIVMCFVALPLLILFANISLLV